MQYIHSLVTRIIGRISRLFGKEQPEFAFFREPFNVPPKEPRKQRKPREDRSELKRNLADLLEHLDTTFDAVKLPTDRLSWITRDASLGLKRLGVYVPDPWAMKIEKDPAKIRADVSKQFPALMALSLSNPNTFDGEYYHPTMLFAIKHKRLPLDVRYTPGIPYQFGFTVKYEEKNMWMYCNLVVNDRTGEITICDELRPTSTRIPTKKSAAKRAHGKARTVTTKKWCPPQMLSGTANCTPEKQRIWGMNSFLAMLNWWNERGNRWNVAVKRGKERVTFAVEPQNTKVYFADRDKSARTATGQAKKIIHYVRSHDRVRNGRTVTVKEHIRGLREFDWGNSHIIVTAPTFHNVQLSSAFDNPSLDEEEIVNEETIGAAEVGRILAEHEDSDLRQSRH